MHTRDSRRRRDDEPLGCLLWLFLAAVLAMGVAAFEAARQPNGFAP
jgi:hypothetical protein